MSLFIKSSLTAAFRNPGIISNSTILYKVISPSDLANTNTLISLAKAFLADEGINYQSSTDQFQEDGTLNIDFLYSEFAYQDGYSSVDKNTTFLLPDEYGYNTYIDTYEKVGRFLYQDNLESLDEVNQSSYAIEARVYESIFLNKYYYNLANKKCFYQYQIDIDIPNADSIYVNYSLAKSISFLITPSDGNLPYIKNVVFISSDQLEYQEDLSSQYYQSGGNYYADSSLNPLYLSLLESFFPFIVIKKNLVIHGPVYSSLNATNDPIEFNQDSYVSIDSFDFEEPALPIISCRLSDDGSRDGYAIITYANNTDSVYDAQLCGEIARTRFMVIRSLDESSLSLYKNFTTISTYLVDIYAYQFRYIAYKYLVNNQDTYSIIQDNGSVATQTVKYASQAIDFSKYASIKEDTTTGVVAISLSFVVYQTSNTESARLVYELPIPVTVNQPTISDSSFLGTSLVVATNYATNIIYYFGNNSSATQTVAVNDTADGTNQKTSIDVTGKTGTVTVVAYNYFYTLDIVTKGFYITESSTVQIQAPITIPSLSLQVKTGSPYVAQTIYDVSAGTSSTTLSFTDFAQNSSSSYYVLANYSSAIEYAFVFTFTLGSGSTSLDLVIGDFYTRLQSGSTNSITRTQLFASADADGYIYVTLTLDENLQYKIPIQFKNVSSNAPQITSISTPALNLDGSGNATMSFNINHKYSKKIQYTIKNNNGTILYTSIIPEKDYSTLQQYFSSGSTATEEITTESFPMGENATSVYVEVVCSNLNTSGVETSVTSSSSNIPTVKRLNQTAPAIFKFYTDSAKTTVATTMVKGQNYYAFLQLIDILGNEIGVSNYGDYVDTSSIEVLAVESQDANIDIDSSVSVNDLENFLYEINVGPESQFNDTSFSIRATFTSITD